MAYVLPASNTDKNTLTYLPMKVSLKNTNDHGIVDWYQHTDKDQVYAMFKRAVDDGQSYPQMDTDEESFKNFYLSHDVFVMRDLNSRLVLGSFYVKPNFPGRSSHICNGGFLVQVEQRQSGIGEALFKAYLRIARDLGYEGSFFNLVYACNVGSLKICRKLGFSEVGVVPKAGKLKDIGYCDAVQFYYDLTTLNENGEPIWGWPK